MHHLCTSSKSDMVCGLGIFFVKLMKLKQISKPDWYTIQELPSSFDLLVLFTDCLKLCIVNIDKILGGSWMNIYQQKGNKNKHFLSLFSHFLMGDAHA